MATAFEKSTPAIPGTENMEHVHALQRVSLNPHTPTTQTSLALAKADPRVQVHDYPVVKQTLETAYNLVQSNSVASYVYETATNLAAKVLASTEPLQQRLPLEKVDGYANQTLDFVEKKFPVVKEDTNVILQKVRGPADSAVGLGKAYADGFQSVSLRSIFRRGLEWWEWKWEWERERALTTDSSSPQRLSPATEAVTKRIADTQETLKALQDKFAATVASG